MGKIKESKGFTLVELMVVISIVAILIAISVSVFANLQASGRNTKRKSDLAVIQSALEQYHNDQNYYPDSIASGISFTGTTTKTYLKTTPKDPKGVNYIYVALPSSPQCTSNCKNIVCMQIWKILLPPLSLMFAKILVKEIIQFQLHEKKNGFTLVEIMITITIVAVLAAVSVSIFANVQKNNRNQKRIRDLQSIKQALEMYRSDNGIYPADVAAMLPSGNKYLASWPTDPMVGWSYIYQPTYTSSVITGFVVCAKSEGTVSGYSLTACTDSDPSYTIGLQSD